MKVYNFFFVSLLILGVGCASSPEELGTTMADSLMIEIFVDIHLINARAELGYGNIQASLDSIIAHHGFSRFKYDQQIDFYVQHPDAYVAVLNKVTQRMTEVSRSISGF